MKNKISTISFLILLTITISAQVFSQTQTVSIRLGESTGQDAYIGTNYPFTTFGYDPDIVAIAWTNMGEIATGRSLFQFYLNSIPHNVIITHANLSLFGNPAPSNPPHFGENASYLRRINTQWDSKTVVWPTQPAFTFHNQVLLPRTTTIGQSYLEINVTALVQDMINNPATSFGFILMCTDEQIYKSMNFASSDCTDTTKRPVLQITYSPVGIDPISTEIPTQFKTYQNYPNPFNPNTNIKFDIPKKAFVNISVFDMLGRNVETLVNGSVETGSYNVNWNAENYSSGQYFYKLISDNFIETKRMTLLK